MSLVTTLGLLLACGTVAPAHGQDDAPRVPPAAKVEVAEGKIVIIDENGERREIDVSGAKRIVLSRAAERIVRDGKEDVQVTGKAIVIDPNGEKIEIELGSLDMEGMGKDGNHFLLKMHPQLDALSGQTELLLTPQAAVSKYYIGVSCAPVDETLAAHLGLTAGTGLVVKHVTPESPAAQSGILVNDILLNAEDKELVAQSDLAAVVNDAGQRGEPVVLTAIREGKERTISVQPAERKQTELFGQLQPFDFKLEGPLVAEWMGPGFLRGNVEGLQEAFDAETIAERFKQFELDQAKVVEELRQRASELSEKFGGERMAEWRGELDQRLGAEMQERLRQMTAELEAARAELATMRDKMREMVREMVEKELQSLKDK